MKWVEPSTQEVEPGGTKDDEYDIGKGEFHVSMRDSFGGEGAANCRVLRVALT